MSTEKQIPSLNEYSSQPWTEWVNKTAKVSTILIDKETNCNKYSNVRLLPRKDVSLYGLFPKMDQRVLNECDQCRAIILPEAFVAHSHNCASEITLIKKKHGAKSKKKKDRYMTMRVPAPPLFQFPPSYDSKPATENDLQQRKEEENNEQLVSGIEQIDLITDSNKSEFGCERSDGGHRNDSGDTGPAPRSATCGEREIDAIISESADTATHQTGGAAATDGGSAIAPPSATTPPPPAPSISAAAACNITSNSCATSAPLTAITVTIPVVPATAQHSSIASTGAIIVATAAGASASAINIGDNNAACSSSSSGPSYRRHKKSGRSSRSATLATMAASAATPTVTAASTSGTSTHSVDGAPSAEQTSVPASHALAHPTKLTSTATVVIVSSAATATSTNSAPTVAASSLLTISCDIIISIKPRPKAAQQQSVRSVRSAPVSAKVAVLPLPPIVATGPLPVHIPIPIPAVLPPKHLSHGARGQISRSVVNSLRPGTSLLSPRTVASVRPRVTVEREQERYRSLLRRANEHRCLNTAIPLPTHHKLKQLHKQHHQSIRSASRGFLPCCSTTPSYIAAAHPVALVSPLQIGMYKTQEHTNTNATGPQWMNQQMGIGQLRNTNASIVYNGHPKPLTLVTASTRRFSDTFLLQGQRVDSQLHDIQTYLSKRFTNTANAKVQSSDNAQLLDQSSPLHHHSNQHNHHHRPNILKNSNSSSSGGTRVHSTSSGIGSKRSASAASAKEDATSSPSSSASSSSSPAAKVRHIGNTTSVAEVNGIILHADLSSESASEAPSFTLPVGLVVGGDSADDGVPLSPTETMNAIHAITVAPDTCDFSELHMFEVSQ